jgi:DNA-binding MarR family transcriptional regulator
VYTSFPTNINPCACTTVKKVSRVLTRVYDAEIAPEKINITQLAVLRCLARRRGEPLSRVAEEMEMDRTSLYRAIKPMIRDGWLISIDGKSNRSHVEVSSKGRSILKQANRRWDIVQREVIGNFGQRAYDHLLSELYRLTDCAARVQTKARA